MLRAGEAGRTAPAKGDGDGPGGGTKPLEVGWPEGGRVDDGTGGGTTVVGVACGVEAAELAFAIEIGAGVDLAAEDG